MTVELNESVQSLARTNKPGRVLLTLIQEGQGSSGYYLEDTLKKAVEDKVFHKDLKMYGDHPTLTEQQERPEGSIFNAVGKLLEDAYWNPNGKRVQAEALIYPSVKDVIYERHEDIGASIRGRGRVDDNGNVVSVGPVKSVDLVTEAGAGGSITELLESARPAVVLEATDNDVRRYLADAVSDLHSSETTHSYLEDFDADYVYFRRHIRVDDHNHQVEKLRQRYVLEGVAVKLEGEPQGVESETTYTLLNPEPELSESATAGGIPVMEIQESEYQRLTASAGRVPVLESEVEAAVKRAEEAENQLAEANKQSAVTKAEGILESAFEGLNATNLKANLLESVTANPEEFDADAFKEKVTGIAEELTESQGEPKVQNFGTTNVTESKNDSVSDEDIVKILEGAR